MKRTYPYLQDSYIYNSKKELEKRNFLAKIDNFANQRQYVRLTLLSWTEEPIKEIQGIITSGSISKDGSSAIRTTCSLSCNVGYGEYDVQDSQADFALNKKIFVEIGVKNDTEEYPEYPILWFPQGVFFIGSFSCSSSSSSSVVINLTLKDKMAMLSGDVGGKLPALTRFDTMWTQLPTGEEVEQKVLIYQIIQELVNHYGGEQLGNIVIEDIPNRIRKVMKWNGDNPLYMQYIGNSENGGANNRSILFTLIKPPEDSAYLIFNNGDDVGYIMADFVIPDELTANAGESVVSVLTKIKELLGNYEFFYDEMGIFHFREIKNYVNTTQGKLVLEESSQNQYLVETNNSKSVYTFTDTGNITSINVTPQYENIKNDYVILGLRQSTSSDIAYEVRYHLAIDEKPKPLGTDPADNRPYYAIYGNKQDYILVIYSEKSSYGYTGNIIAGFAKDCAEFPSVGNVNQLYYNNLEDDVYCWNGSIYERVCIYDNSKPEPEKEQHCIIYSEEKGSSDAPYHKGVYYVKDWRTFYYLKGKKAEVDGLDKGYYYEELSANWPTVYDLINQEFYAESYQEGTEQNNPLRKIIKPQEEWRTLTDGNYYLDFINASTSSLGEFGVNTIGRRSLVVKEDKINCLFEPEIPDVNILNIDNLIDNLSQNTALNPSEDLNNQREESNKRGQPYTQVTNEIYQNLVPGGYHNAAFDRIKYELYLHTRYQKSVSLTALPVFYLSPNVRVTINEKSTNTYGDYVIQNIGLTLGPGANMSISANEVFERE